MTEKNNLNKYVIYNPMTLQSYEDYGISIPMLNERVTKTFDFISKKYSIEITPKEQLNNHGLELLSLAHDPQYVEDVSLRPDDVVLKTYELIDSSGNYHRYDPVKAIKPLKDFILKALGHVNGTILAASRALENGTCYHLGGGMHHAMSHRPGGFCMFNDIVIAIRYLQSLKKIKKALVIDMDAHKGDGTAQICLEDDSIKTFSIHMKEGWPLDKLDKADPSFSPSDLDIGLLPQDDYLDTFKRNVEKFINIYDDYDLCIVVHGADVYEYDELESANLIQLSLEQVFKRDELIYELLKQKKVPQAWVMAGGYGKRVHEVFTQGLDMIISREQESSY